MNETQKQAVELLTLDNDEYFQDENQLILRLQKKLGAIGAGEPLSKPPSAPPKEVLPVLALGAPARVNLDVHNDFPVLVATQQTGRRRWEVNYDQNLQLLVSDLRTGKVSVGQPLFDNRSGEFEPSMSGNPPDAINAAMLLSSVRRFNLLERIEFPGRPTRIALTAISYDWVSNTQISELKGGSQEFESISARSRSSFITYKPPADATPKIASPALAALIVPRTAVAGDAIRFHAAIRVDQSRVVLVPDKETENSILLVSLLLLKLDDMNPPLIELAVPVASTGKDPLATSFSFDLREALGGRTLSGTYQVYLVIGDAVSGPYLMTVGS